MLTTSRVCFAFFADSLMAWANVNCVSNVPAGSVVPSCSCRAYARIGSSSGSGLDLLMLRDVHLSGVLHHDRGASALTLERLESLEVHPVEPFNRAEGLIDRLGVGQARLFHHSFVPPSPRRALQADVGREEFLPLPELCLQLGQLVDQMLLQGRAGGDGGGQLTPDGQEAGALSGTAVPAFEHPGCAIATAQFLLGSRQNGVPGLQGQPSQHESSCCNPFRRRAVE
jgi:hypothetical protein